MLYFQVRAAHTECMVTVLVGNSYSQIRGMSPGQETEIRKLLSYTTDAGQAYFSGGRQHRRYLIDKRGYFPTGLLHRLPDWEAMYQDMRLKPSSKPAIEFKSLPPYPDQLKAVDVAVKVCRGTLSLPTGTGKSLVIALIASRLNVKTLVVVPSLEIKKQLQEAVKALKNVTIHNIDSPALAKAKDFDCLIIDEAHHTAAKTYQKLNKTAWTGIYYRYFLTGTAFRNNVEETLLFEAIAGEVIYKLDYKTAVTRGYIVPVEAYYLDIPKQPTDAYTYAEVYSQLVVNNEARNNAISALLLRLSLSQVPTLCLVKEVAHGKLLARLTGLPFVSGADDDSRGLIDEFNTGGIKSLIGTAGILGEGVDTKPAEFVVIAGLGKAKSQFMQQVGRGVRRFNGKESAKIIIIRDGSHKFTLRHFNAQKRILLDEYGARLVKLEL